MIGMRCWGEPAQTYSDATIQKQMGRAGATLVVVAGDGTTNVLKDLKGERLPEAVRTLHEMVAGDRIRTARQLAYFMKGARTNEVCGFQSVALFSYFWFTPEEVERATKEITVADGDFPKDILKEMLWMARQQHPTKGRTEPPSAGAPGGQ